MIDPHMTPTTAVSIFGSIEPYKVDTFNEVESSGGGNGRGELDVIIASETSRAAFGDLVADLQDNYSQLFVELTIQWLNLSIADAMVSSLIVTFNYIYMLDNDWPFGEIYCKISQFIATLSISASVFTLMAISIDRYVAIMKPLKPRMSKRCNLGIAAFIWIASIAISCPMLFFFTTGEVELKDGIRIVCYAEWPDGPTNHSQQENVYNIVFMILTYILPIISMTVTYSRVGIKFWGSKTSGEYTPRHMENVRRTWRVGKMMTG